MQGINLFTTHIALLWDRMIEPAEQKLHVDKLAERGCCTNCKKGAGC